MRQNLFHFSSMAMLLLGLLLAIPGALSQMRNGAGMAGQNGNMNQPGNTNQPGMTPNGSQRNGAMDAQNNPETGFVANMRRNSKVETDLSKLALKNSSNDGVKNLAQQVISENRRNEMALTSATSNANASSMPLELPVPNQTRQAEKKMKKLTGTQFDGMYLAQMNGYVKSDRKIIGESSSVANSPDIGSLTMQMRNTADERLKQIAQVAQSENMKIE